MVQDRAIVTMNIFIHHNGRLIESHKWSIERAIFDDFERPRTKISRSGHFLTLNIFEMAKDTAIVSMEAE